MSNRSRAKHKGRKESGRFLALPLAVLNSPNFRALSHRAVHMLICIYAQYYGSNNGDLSATMSHLGGWGWNSNDQIKKAVDELLDRGMIIRTRVGGFRKSCHLYAVTFQSIDECKGKLDVSPTTAPPGDWKKEYVPRDAVQLEPSDGVVAIAA